MVKRVMVVVAVIGMMLIGGSAIADDLPKWKSGPGKITITDAGGAATTMQRCSDGSTDQPVRAMGAKQPCSKNEWHRDGDRRLTETV